MTQPRGKVAKYLDRTRTEEPPPKKEKTTPPGGSSVTAPVGGPVTAPAGGTVTAHTIEVDETLFQNSLTPTNVLKKIHQDIVRVIGIRPGYDGKLTPLEKKLVQTLEKVIRKGHCPSLLYRDTDLRHVLECLQRYYESAKVQIEDDTGGPGETVPVFSSLMTHTRTAAELEKQIKELRNQVSKQTDANRKQAIKNRIDLLKARKDHCLIMYQKIVFSDAESLQAKRKQRLVSLFGKPCTLDDLLSFFKKGGSISNAEGGKLEIDDAGLGDPLDNKPPSFDSDPDFSPPVDPGFADDTFNTGYNLNFQGDAENDDLSLTFDDHSEEVVDWVQIKRQNRNKSN